MPCGTLAEVEPVLKGLMYPANKQDIIQQAKKNNADQLTLDGLEKLPEGKFYSHRDVVKGLGGTV
jgi:hypothetical protein